MKRIVFILILITLLVGCTEQQRARNFGGNAKTMLPKGQKLIVATWKNDDLWLLTRPMKEGEIAESYSFQEDSSFGVMEGTVTIIEQQ